jgi:hypothetical protein
MISLSQLLKSVFSTRKSGIPYRVVRIPPEMLTVAPLPESPLAILAQYLSPFQRFPVHPGRAVILSYIIFKNCSFSSNKSPFPLIFQLDIWKQVCHFASRKIRHLPPRSFEFFHKPFPKPASSSQIAIIITAKIRPAQKSMVTPPFSYSYTILRYLPDQLIYEPLRYPGWFVYGI